MSGGRVTGGGSHVAGERISGTYSTSELEGFEEMSIIRISMSSFLTLRCNASLSRLTCCHSIADCGCADVTIVKRRATRAGCLHSSPLSELLLHPHEWAASDQDH